MPTTQPNLNLEALYRPLWLSPLAEPARAEVRQDVPAAVNASSLREKRV